MRSLDDAPFLDIFDPVFMENPGSPIDEVRRQSCLARTAIGVLVVEHATVLALLGDPRLHSSLLDFLRIQGLDQGPIYDSVATSLLAIDGPDHTRLRKLVSRAFTPRSVERLRPAMRALAEELTDAVVPAGRCEFMTDFADRYPIQLICELLGVPRRDYPLFGGWANALTWVLSLEVGAHLDEVAEGLLGIGNYIEAFIAERRVHPEDDLVTALIQTEDGGDRLSPAELRTLIASLLFAGYDTTRNQLAIGLYVFTQFPISGDSCASGPSSRHGRWRRCSGSMGRSAWPRGWRTRRFRSATTRFRPARWCRCRRSPPTTTRRCTRRPNASTSPSSASRRSPSAADRTTAWGRTSRAPRCRRRSSCCRAACRTFRSTARSRGGPVPVSSARHASRSDSPRPLECGAPERPQDSPPSTEMRAASEPGARTARDPPGTLTAPARTSYGSGQRDGALEREVPRRRSDAHPIRAGLDAPRVVGARPR